MNIGEEIRNRRKALGLTQAKLAYKIGVKQGYIADLERGRKSPSIATLQPFLDALGGDLRIVWESMPPT